MLHAQTQALRATVVHAARYCVLHARTDPTTTRSELPRAAACGGHWVGQVHRIGVPRPAKVACRVAPSGPSRYAAEVPNLLVHGVVAVANANLVDPAVVDNEHVGRSAGGSVVCVYIHHLHKRKKRSTHTAVRSLRIVYIPVHIQYQQIEDSVHARVAVLNASHARTSGFGPRMANPANSLRPFLQLTLRKRCRY